jgi:hypothetical protein
MRRFAYLLVAGLVSLGVTGVAGGCGGGGGGGGGPSAPPPSVLIVHAISPGFIADLQGKLTAFGYFPTVDAFNAAAGTPTLVELQAYDAILVVSDTNFSDSVTLGDNVADYVDGGGAVVVTEFTNSNPGDDTLQGRFATDDYYVIPRAVSNGSAGPFGLLALDSGHPIFDGVSSFSGGTGSHRPFGSVVPGAYNLLAVWDDGASTPLVATRGIAGVRRADLGFFPVTTDGYGSGVDPASGGAMRIVANALLWAAGSI